LGFSARLPCVMNVGSRESPRRQGPFVEHPQEARWAAAVLDIGLAGAVRRTDEYAGLGGDERGEFRRDRRVPASPSSIRAYAAREPFRAWMALTVGVKATSLAMRDLFVMVGRVGTGIGEAPAARAAGASASFARVTTHGRTLEVHRREVDLGLRDFIHVVGQRVERDVSHDFHHLRVAVAGVLHRGVRPVSETCPRSRATRAAKRTAASAFGSFEAPFRLVAISASSSFATFLPR